jgi:hypothetical protein
VVRRPAIAALLGFAGIASCTIYALSDDIHQEKCEIGRKFDYDSCEALNNRSDPDFDRCKNWRCGADHYCEIGPLDQDRDGYFPAACVPAGSPSDCADRDPTSHPDGAEVCDGKDNDCDRAIDEGMLQVDERVAMTFDDEVSALAFSWDDVTNDVGVVARRANDDAVSFGFVATARSQRAQPVWLSDSDEVFRASAVNIAPRSGNFVLSAIEAAPTHRIFVGNVAGGVTRAIFAVGDLNLRQTGLRCASDEPCAALQGPRTDVLPDDPEAVPPTGPAPTIAPSTRPELAILGPQLLVGYARTLEPAADGCEITEPAAPLLLNLLELRASGFAALTDSATRLDLSSELRSPLILPIDTGLVIGAREPFGWLVGYLDTSGGLVFRRSRAQSADDVQLRLVRDPEPYLEAQMVLGPADDNRFMIGVAARAGCGEQARVVFGLLQLTWDSEGRTELRVYRELHEVGESGQRASRPVLAYNRAQSLWAVAYATPDGLFARVLDSNGLPIGDSSYRLTDALPPIPDMTIVSGAPDAFGLFTEYSYEERTDQSPSHVLVGRELRTCLDSSSTTLIDGGR